MLIPQSRHSVANEKPVRPDGDYVVYWMTAQRRTRHNFALQHAVETAAWLEKPLLVFEPLRTGYRWASDRLHRFVIEGMRDNAAACEAAGVAYFPYVEPAKRAAEGLIDAVAANACTVITDEYPCFFLPKMIRLVRQSIPARLELVDGNGIMPLADAQRSFTVAHSYRRWMQKNILPVLAEQPAATPLADATKLPKLDRIPQELTKRWPCADIDDLLANGGLDHLAIDHSVAPTRDTPGGSLAAEDCLGKFISRTLARYDEDRNHPDENAESGLSAYLHFGHIAASEVVAAVFECESWTIDQVGEVNGKNHGFWNVSPAAEGFLDQMLTWRELSFNQAYTTPRTYDSLDSIPDWAKRSIEETKEDERPHLYSLEQFESSQTHDPLWNAAQRELVASGKMHNYMRMLWGKKILHWTPSAAEALRVMVHLNNKYALDGRDPNSYCGILWCFGRADRAWGPKRPVFGSMRYMTSDSARKKLRMTEYLERWA